MDKYTLLKEAIYLYNPDIDNIFKTITKYNPHITVESFLLVISKDTYNLERDLPSSSRTITNILKKVFPTRVTGASGDRPDNFLLGIYEYKWCGRCKQVHPFENFRKNKALKYGLNAYCKVCHLETTSSTQNGRQSEYRCAKLNRTPSWADLDKIKEFYINCPEGTHVDHIIPLQGELVSGLHVLENLQYLSQHDNCAKHNKFDIY